MHRFENKVVVVTGGSSGKCLAAAKAFAAEGAHVYITGRRQHELDLAAASIGRNASAVRADASVTADLEQLYQTVGERHGRIDVVFANAGYVEKGALGELSEQQYARQFDSNVKGVLFTVQLALPLMSAGGSIVLNGSINGSKGFAGSSLYSASKAAIRSFARSQARAISPSVGLQRPASSPVARTDSSPSTRQPFRSRTARSAKEVPWNITRRYSCAASPAIDRSSVWAIAPVPVRSQFAPACV